MLLDRMPPAIEAITAYLQKDRSFVEKYDVAKLFRLWGNYVERISFFNRYPEMTDHGQLHINNIVTIVAQMVLPRLQGDGGKKGEPPFMSRTELFCLVAGAWLHDIGMYETYDEETDDPMYIRKVHGRLSMEKMFDERHLLFPEMTPEDVRLIGGLAAYHQSRAPLDRSQAEALGNKRVPHLPTLEELGKQAGFQKHLTFIGEGKPLHGQDGRPSEQVRLKFVASIIRLADQCDVQMTRSGNVNFMVRQLDRARSHLRANEEIVREASKDSAAHKRASIEVGYFKSSVEHFMRNFWVERVLILKDQIVIKMTDPKVMDRELDDVAKIGKFDEAIQSIRDSLNLGLEFFNDDAHKYINGDHARIKTYLEEHNLKLDVVNYDVKRHRPLVAPATFIRDSRIPAMHQHAVVAKSEATRLADELHRHKTVRSVVVYGPHGRSRRPFGREVALQLVRNLRASDESAAERNEQPRTAATGKSPQLRVSGEPSAREVTQSISEHEGPSLVSTLSISVENSVLWHTVSDEHQDQAASFVQDASWFLARNGEFQLENLLRGERLVTHHHVDLMIDMMNAPAATYVIVLDSFNHVNMKSRSFFLKLLRKIERARFILLTTRIPDPLFIEPEWYAALAGGLPTAAEWLAKEWLAKKSKEVGGAATEVPAPDSDDSSEKTQGAIHALGLPTEEERLAAWNRSVGGIRFADEAKRKSALDRLWALWEEFGWEPAEIPRLMDVADVSFRNPDFLVESFRHAVEAELDESVSRLGSQAERQLVHLLGWLDQPFSGDEAGALGLKGFDYAFQALVARALVVPEEPMAGPSPRYRLHPAFCRRAKLFGRGTIERRREGTLMSGKRLKELGVEPGPLFGRILNLVAEGEANGSITTADQADALARKLAGEADLAGRPE